MKTIVSYSLLLFFLSFFSTGCSEDKPEGTIFDPSDIKRNQFDLWLLDHYVNNYNIDLKYRIEDMEIDQSYNLVPATMDNSIKLAKLIKHLWLESYDEIAGIDFMRTYAPKVIHLIGSPAINAEQQTEVLGTAEGGLMVTLYKVNELNLNSIDSLNYYYFKTMHHEFAHILHQTKNYPKDFDKISTSDYSPSGWMNRKEEEALQMGFVSPYASSEPQEDFVEVIAIYLTHSNAYWEELLEKAGTEGSTIIQKKFTIVRNWLRTSWNIDIDKLRSTVERRSKEIQNLDYSLDQ